MRPFTTDVLAYYDAHAVDYAQRTLSADMASVRERLLNVLAPGAYILEAGCGSGRDARAFLERGYKVRAFDGSPALAALASRHIGQAVEVLTFEEAVFEPEFDAVYACASLLHLEETALPVALRNLLGALKPCGVMLVLFKHGQGLRIEAETGRLFNDMDEARITAAAHAAGGIVEATWVDADAMGRNQAWLCALIRPRARATG